MKKLLPTIIMSLISLSLFAHDSNTSGNWNSSSSWNPSTVPADNGDTILIQSSHTITLSSNTTYTNPMVIIVEGTLKLNATLTLAAGSIIIVNGGKVTSGNNGFRLDIGAQTWGGLKNNPITSGSISDIVLSLKTAKLNVSLINETDIRYDYSLSGNDINLSDLELQKSLDGKEFVTVTQLDNQSITGNGELFDVGNVSIAYYRIKAVEGDKEIYSNIEKIENLNFQLAVYPNPFQDRIIVNIEGEFEGYTYQVYDIIGNLVSQNQLNSSLDLTDLNSGVYYLKIYNNLVQVANQKIIKN